MTDLIVAHGLVVGGTHSATAHVVVDDGRITALLDARQPVPPADRVIDATDRVVLPGGVDGHCHVAQITGPYRTLDDYALTTAAALRGGTTTILDFGIPRDATETPLAAIENKLDLARQARCDVGLHASVIDWDPTVADQLERLAALGVRSVKLYMTNRGVTMAGNDTVLKVMREMARLDGLTYVHAEHDAIVVDCTHERAAAGEIGIEHLHRTRPELAEEASVREVLAMAEYTGAPVYFVHQSTPGAVDLARAARARGLAVHSETCPHYLMLDDRVYAGRVPEWYACCPPMRSPETVAALRDRFAAGAIDTVASDHSCYDLTQKRAHRDDVRLMPHGLPGVETRMPVAFTALTDTLGSCSDPVVLQRFADLFAAAPARINAIPGKGVIAPGYDADLVVLDPAETRTVAAADLHMGSDFSPFEGMRLRGWPQVVIAAGRIVLDGNGFHDPGPVGRYLPRLGYRDRRPLVTTRDRA
ncbi:amidohydrolase family protein [Nocardia sp. BMG111209]|uniref:amidohydrolase family protein n=1 Tax=Nocardia sp. BMG111209 TaxID=1160137 RepID=UPI00036B2DAA|nr:amidohydrolase family protein [Nocardia sp. BMG111209]